MKSALSPSCLSGLAGLLLLALLTTNNAWAGLVVYGLSKDVAFVKIDGKQRVLRVGKPSPEGYELVSADSRLAKIRFKGQLSDYPVTTEVSTRFTTRKPASRKLVVKVNNQGQYIVDGKINAKTIRMLVDTGANTMALSAAHARALGLDYQRGRRGQVSTAGGVVTAWYVRLAEVSVGSISLRNVEAAVAEGNFPEEVLLGMSFLGQVHIQQRDGVMTLQP